MGTDDNTRRPSRVGARASVANLGLRVNRLLSVHKWAPVVRPMPRMISELERRPESGLLHAESCLGGRTVQMVQYWRSFDHLHANAHARDLNHLPAWAAFNRGARGNTAVGIVHETYLVPAGRYECIHVNMPRRGLLRAGEPVPVTARTDDARQRLAADGNAAPSKMAVRDPAPSLPSTAPRRPSCRGGGFSRHRWPPKAATRCAPDAQHERR
jgi:hypothetical protein